jgi:2-keto-3-deoxy-6-phosphogluconate aldolase
MRCTSTWTDDWVELPLDEQRYFQLLQERIASSVEKIRPAARWTLPVAGNAQEKIMLNIAIVGTGNISHNHIQGYLQFGIVAGLLRWSISTRRKQRRRNHAMA